MLNPRPLLSPFLATTYLFVSPACSCVCVAMPHGSWILVPRAGIKPVPTALEVQSLNHWIAREVPLPPVLMGQDGAIDLAIVQTLIKPRWRACVCVCIIHRFLDLNSVLGNQISRVTGYYLILEASKYAHFM